MLRIQTLAWGLALSVAAHASPLTDGHTPGEELLGSTRHDVTGTFDYDAPGWSPDTSPTLAQTRERSARTDLAPTALFAPTAVFAPTALSMPTAMAALAPTALVNLAPTAMSPLLPTAAMPTAGASLMPTAAMPTSVASLMPTAAMPTAVASLLPTAAPNAHFTWVPSAIPTLAASTDGWWRWLADNPLERQYWSFVDEADAPAIVALLTNDTEHVAG